MKLYEVERRDYTGFLGHPGFTGYTQSSDFSHSTSGWVLKFISLNTPFLYFFCHPSNRSRINNLKDQKFLHLRLFSWKLHDKNVKSHCLHTCLFYFDCINSSKFFFEKNFFPTYYLVNTPKPGHSSVKVGSDKTEPSGNTKVQIEVL